MNTSILCPPNKHLLSDDIISAAVSCPTRVQKRIAYSNGKYANFIEDAPDLPHRGSVWSATQTPPQRVSATNVSNHHSRSPRIEAEAEANKVATKKRRTDDSPTSCSPKRQHTHDTSNSHPSVNILKANVDSAKVSELITLGKELHRERCREIQKRHRAKQNNWLVNLEKTTHQLRADVSTLEEKRYSITAGVLSKLNIWNVAVKYFNFFRYGLAVGSQDSQNGKVPLHMQLHFIQHAMAPDVACSSGFGREAMMKSWRWLQFFDDVQVELRVMKNSTENAVDAVTRTHVTITEHTLRNLFPQLLDKNEDTASEFATKLLGRRIVMHGSVHFEWDNARGLVTSVMAESDMLTPLLRLLGSLEHVCLVFDKARVSPDFQWRP